VTGKITLRRLPEFDGPPPAPVLDGARIHMSAGEAAPILNGGPWRFVAYLEFLPGTGAWRGNHYHEFKHETFYIVKGRLRGVFEDMDTGETLQLELAAGDLVTIAPRCAHAFAALEYAEAIEVSPLVYDASDAHPHVLAATR